MVLVDSIDNQTYKKIITHPLKAAVGANIITEFIPDKISPLILKLEEYSELLKEGDEYRKSLFLNNLSENEVTSMLLILETFFEMRGIPLEGN